MNRQGDDDFDPLNILDFNFTLEQVLTRIGINTGWVSSWLFNAQCLNLFLLGLPQLSSLGVIGQTPWCWRLRLLNWWFQCKQRSVILQRLVLCTYVFAHGKQVLQQVWPFPRVNALTRGKGQDEGSSMLVGSVLGWNTLYASMSRATYIAISYKTVL